VTNNSVTAYGHVSVALGLSDFDDIVGAGVMGGLYGLKDEDFKLRWPNVYIGSILLVVKPVVMGIR